MVYPPPGTYCVTTGRRLTADEASCGLFDPDDVVVCVHAELHGPSVTFTYMVDKRETAT